MKKVYQIVSIVFFIIIVILLLKPNRAKFENEILRADNELMLKDIDSLNVAAEIHTREITTLKNVLNDSEKLKQDLYKKNASLQKKYNGLFATITPNTPIDTVFIVLEVCDSLVRQQATTISMMQLREIEFKQLVNNQDSLIKVLYAKVALNSKLIANKDAEIKNLIKQRRAVIWQRNIIIVAGVAGIIFI